MAEVSVSNGLETQNSTVGRHTHTGDQQCINYPATPVEPSQHRVPASITEKEVTTWQGGNAQGKDNLVNTFLPVLAK